MPLDPKDYMPSWITDETGDVRPEDGGPLGKVTEDQVRQYFRAAGWSEEDIEKVMTNATGAHDPANMHKGGNAKDPLGEPPITDRSKAEDELDTLENRDETTMPKPMFQGDRMGR